MKFAKSMEDLMVPEWSSQYIHYKVAKQKIKTVTADLNRPHTPARTSFPRTRNRASACARDLHHRWRSHHDGGPEPPKTPRPSSAPHSADLSSVRFPSIHISQPVSADRRDASSAGSTDIATSLPSFSHFELAPPDLMLPDPIQPLGPLIELGPEVNIPINFNPPNQPLPPESTGLEAAQPLPSTMPSNDAPKRPRPTSTVTFTRPISTTFTRPLSTIFTRNPASMSPRPFVSRVSSFFGGSRHSMDASTIDITEAQLKASTEFQQWLLMELNKIENFYKRRESEAIIRFDEMKEQLEILRSRWLKAHSQANGEFNVLGNIDERLEHDANNPSPTVHAGGSESMSKFASDISTTHRRIGWKTPFVTMTRLNPHDSMSREAMEPAITHRLDAPKGYEYRKPMNDPPHRLAKSKLKRAFIEFYRRLELLKSYVCVNRDTFGKITKKFDKASGLRTSHKFLNEHINKSYFAGSENMLDDLMNEAEILFARFFMKSNRKSAAIRLRTRENKSAYHSSLLRSGFYLGSSLVVGAYGVWQALGKLNSKDLAISQKTNYSLQLWGGIFLLLLQVLLFAVNLRIWARCKINYAFIFEFDAKYQLDHRQFLEIPSLFLTLFAVCFWFSAYDFWPGQLDMTHFPLIFVSIAVGILFNPIKRFYFRSRKFFLLTLGRVALSGIKRVEFRDFWVGDMLCSQTYALGNISLFFCLFAHHWNTPDQCSSSRSRLMGFFTTLPAILRCFQCLGRYKDTRHFFPHLANSLKYACTVGQYVLLSLWRMNMQSSTLKASFMAIATITSFYSIFWDIVMDWSLLNPYARWPFVRDAVGYNKRWVYYFGMLSDPLLRFSWVFYIVYSDEIQHTAKLSFILATLEVIRRFIWCFLRMENEHVGNVGANRAYHDPRLPYRFPPPVQVMLPPPVIDGSATPLLITTSVPTVDVERSAVRRRHRSRRRSGAKVSPAMQALERLGRTMTTAHTKDYERKRGTNESEDEDEDTGASSDEEEDGENFYERTASGETHFLPETVRVQR